MVIKTVVVFLSISSFVISQNDIKIISSNNSSLIIEYSPDYVDTSLKLIDNSEFRNIVIAYGILDDSISAGMPQIPHRRITIGVPTEYGNNISVLSTSAKEITGQIILLPEYIDREGIINKNYTQSST